MHLHVYQVGAVFVSVNLNFTVIVTDNLTAIQHANGQTIARLKACCTTNLSSNIPVSSQYESIFARITSFGYSYPLSGWNILVATDRLSPGCLKSRTAIVAIAKKFSHSGFTTTGFFPLLEALGV